MISVMLLLDDVQSAQGPLLVIPESHKNGIVNFEKKAHLLDKNDSLLNSLNSDLKYAIDKDLVKEYAKKNKIISLEGRQGTVIFFHPNIWIMLLKKHQQDQPIFAIGIVLL